MGRELWLQPFWDLIILNPSVKHFCSHFLFGSLVGCLTFIIVCCYFTFFYDLPRYMFTKIQKTQWPTVREILEAAIPQIVIYLGLNYISWKQFDIRWELPTTAPTGLELMRDLTLNFLFGDFLIYWNHRIMHIIPWLRHNIHSVHHKYTACFSWAGGWVHPLEDALVVVTQTIGPLWLIPCHPLSFWIFVLLWVTCLVEEHSGHDVWWSPHKFIPFAMGGGAAPHDIHHSPHTTKNFGFIFAIWDQIFDTYCPPPGEEMKQPKKGENNFLLIVRSIFLLCICGILIIVTQDEINKELLVLMLVTASILTVGYAEGLYEYIGSFLVVWIVIMEYSAPFSFVFLFLTMGVSAAASCNTYALLNMFMPYKEGTHKNALQEVGINISNNAIRCINWVDSFIFLCTLIYFVYSKPYWGDRQTAFYSFFGFMHKFHDTDSLTLALSFFTFFYIVTYFGISMIHDNNRKKPAKTLTEAFSTITDAGLVYFPSLALLMVCLESFSLVPLLGLGFNAVGVYAYTLTLLNVNSQMAQSKVKAN